MTQHKRIAFPATFLIESRLFIFLFLKEEEMVADTAATDYVNDNPVIEVDEKGLPVCPPAVVFPIPSATRILE
mgnify:CR=1 FL=1